MTPPTVPHRHAVGIHRRELLQVGFSGLLGVGLASAARATPAAAPAVRKAKSVLLVFLTGAPSHLDTFDMKPEAPAEIRGDFKIIGAKTPGVHVSEHLPLLAARSDKFALVRT